MGAIDGFMATWSKARDTFGEGTPHDGAQFDRSVQLRRMQSTVEQARPGSQWTGSAADAYDAVNQKHGRILGEMAGLDQKMRAEVDRSAAVVVAGRRDLDAVRQWVVNAASTVPPTAQGERMLYPIVSKGVGEVGEIVSKSNSDLNAIAGRLRGLGGQYQALGNEIKEDGGAEKVIAEKLEEDRKRKAQQDVDAALKGDRDAQQRVRNVLNTIGPEQLSGTTKLTADQSSYLSQMQAQQKLRDVDQLDEAAKNGAGDIMADSWQLMSNPELEFPKTESVDGALEGTTSVRGGFDQLPNGIQSTLQSPGAEQSANLEKIANVSHTGNDHFQTNTDLDRAMMHKVADMMESPQWRNGDPIDNPLDLPMPWESAAPPSHADLERAASSAMVAVSADHQVVHDAITGDVQPGNDYREQFTVNSEHLLYNLTHEEWDDDGAAAGSLFDWTKTAAVGPEAGIAGSTAHAYAEYVGHNSKDLMHLSGTSVIGLDGVHTLGAVNPHLTYSIAEGLTPYVNDIAGIPGGLPSFGGPLDELDQFGDYSMPDTKGLFSVLSSERSTATLWTSEVYEQALLHETAFAQNPSNFGADAHLTSSATLRGLVDTGTVGAFEAFAANQNQIAATEHEWKEFGYDAALKTLTLGGGELPGVGPIAADAIDRVGGGLKDEILGSPDLIDPKDPINDLSPQSAGTTILTSVALAGGETHLPVARYEDGVLVGYPADAHAVVVDGQVVCPPGVSPAEHQAAVVRAVNDTLGPAAGGYSAIEGMATTYNGITKNPNPNG